MQRMDTIIILDFGSQYTQLIARKIRELNIYCEIHPYNKIPALTEEVKGVVFSGSPYSCNAPDAPVPDMKDIKGRLPLLAVCYGAQYLAKWGGGSVQQSATREYGRANLQFVDGANPQINTFSFSSYRDEGKKHLPDLIWVFSTQHC